MRALLLCLLVTVTVAGPGVGASAGTPTPGAETQVARQEVVAFARKQVGIPYVGGRSRRAGYDCSGLVFAAYRSGICRSPTRPGISCSSAGRSPPAG